MESESADEHMLLPSLGGLTLSTGALVASEEPILRDGKREREGEVYVCPVCTDDVVPEEKNAVYLRCQPGLAPHVFHQECLRRCKASPADGVFRCPLCRTPVEEEGLEVVGDRIRTWLRPQTVFDDRVELRTAVLECESRVVARLSDSYVHPDHGHISTWLVGEVTCMDGVFEDCEHFNDDISTWNVSSVTSMEGMFRNAISFNQSLEPWDVTNVTSMRGMFEGARQFNSYLFDVTDEHALVDTSRMFKGARAFDAPLDWDLRNVVRMDGMFHGASSFTGWGNDGSPLEPELFQLPPGSKVESMDHMFAECGEFHADLSSWDVANVRSMRGMFLNASSFNSRLFHLDTTSAVRDVSDMFNGALSFQGLGLSSWNLWRVTNFTRMFCQASSFNKPVFAITADDDAMQEEGDDGDDVVMDGMFCGATLFDQELVHWDVTRVVSTHQMFMDAASFDEPLSEWRFSRLRRASEMFRGAETFDSELFTIEPFRGLDHSGSFDRSLDLKGMFRDAEQFNRDISSWNLHDVHTTEQMFEGARQFTGRGGQAKGDEEGLFELAAGAKVKSMSRMFRGCSDFCADISHWNVEGVTNMSRMFERATDFDCDLSGWDADSLVDASMMFADATSFDSPPFRVWERPGGHPVHPLVSLRGTFAGATEFDQDLSEWDVSSVTDMSRMFARSGFDHPLDAWRVDRLKNAAQMFMGAASFNSPLFAVDPQSTGRHPLRSVEQMFAFSNFDGDLSSWDLSNVTRFDGLFQGARQYTGRDEEGLSTVFRLRGGSTAETKSMESMFSGAAMFNADLSEWDVSDVTTTKRMFAGATQFNSPLFAVDGETRVADVSEMFKGARSFDQDLSNWNLVYVRDMSSFLEDATSFNSPVPQLDGVLHGPTTQWEREALEADQTMAKMFRNATRFNQSLEHWNVERVENMEMMLHGATSFNSRMFRIEAGMREKRVWMMFSNAKSFDAKPNGVFDWDESTLVPPDAVSDRRLWR